MLIPVILSGGVGSRLWPLSREHYPKQLLALVGQNTLLQDTVLRLKNLPEVAPPLVVCNESHRFLIAEQLRSIQIHPEHLILEPEGRNTAPAAAVAALAAQNYDLDPIILVLPADHLIKNVEVFCAQVEAALPLAAAGHLVTFGIVPNTPETGYGYIQAGQAVGESAFKVARFVEKPALALAQEYVAAGDYYWNSGMFLFKASRYLEELEKFAPKIFGACQESVYGATQDEDFMRLSKQAFLNCPSDSIDYAVMERTQDAVILPLDAGWNDVGAWSALWEVSEQDTQGNVCIGDVLTEASENCYLRSEYRLIAALGMKDHIIVETADAVLVAHKDYVQDVKKIVNQLKATARQEADLHRKVHRPWGTYENIDVEERFQVKRIQVKPGASLSLQMHYHRSEHWIVVKGTAQVTRGEETFVLSENQSTYIPLGVKHRLENPGKLPLELIEVQSGSYLGEDDIVRFEDVYGRHAT
ncbi:MAG: mannose-phosphate guanyltransferase [Pseudomonadota bacterium]|jgi:mannose-1-phosphate guanylyltransferase/mannose-6-phosphate isomerase